MSLFELPVSRGARWARIIAVLALDAVLAGAGIAMIVSYLQEREHARQAPAPPSIDAGLADVDVLPPSRATQRQDPSRTPAAHAIQAIPDQAPRSRAARQGNGTPHEPAAPAAKAAAAARLEATPGKAAEDDAAGAGIMEAGIMEAGTMDDETAMTAAGTGNVAGMLAAAEAPATSDAEIEAMTRKVALVVERNTLPLRRCYQQASKASTPDKPLEGRVDIHVEITETGRAANVHPVGNTTESDTLARCVTGLFESWTFPPPPGGTSLELVWPLRFKAPK